MTLRKERVRAAGHASLPSEILQTLCGLYQPIHGWILLSPLRGPRAGFPGLMAICRQLPPYLGGSNQACGSLNWVVFPLICLILN